MRTTLFTFFHTPHSYCTDSTNERTIYYISKYGTGPYAASKKTRHCISLFMLDDGNF